jgi:hypothetical protein
MKKMIFFPVLMATTAALAAIPPQAKKALSNSAILRTSGAIHGGIAGKGFSLLAVQSQPSKNQKLERLTVSVGDPLFQAHQGAPGYFHIENSPETKRVVINFAQTVNAKFNEKNLQQALAKSPFIKSSQLIFEPESQTMSLVLLLKKQASIRAIPVVGKGNSTAQLKIDLFEDSLLNRTKKK